MEKENQQTVSLNFKRKRPVPFKPSMKSIVAFFVTTLAISIISNGCKKAVQVPDAPNKLPTAAVFADSADATAAILGSYIQMMSYSSIPAFVNGELTLCNALASDELYPSTNPSADFQQFYINAVSASSNGKNPLFWSKAYGYIYQANAAIEGLTASTTLSATVRNQLLGEELVLRAMCYFTLVNLYGPIPQVVLTDYRQTSTLPRASTDSIYTQIISDLTTAETLLTSQYPSAGRVRANEYVAAALLSKVYLYDGQWANAENEASKVINSGNYSLPSNLNNVFLAGSNEAVWQLIPLQSGFETADGVTFIPNYGLGNFNTTVPAYALTKYLLNAFEPGDERRAQWVDSSIVNSVTYYFPYKYKLSYDGNSNPLEYYMMIRLADLYLIRAEAEAEQGGGTAVDDLNQIRSRAGLPAYAGGTDKASLLAAIYHERQVEFFCEMGNRWFDLKRTGLANAVMDTVTPTKGGSWSSDWQVLPVPSTEITSNPALIQNPGYQN